MTADPAQGSVPADAFGPIAGFAAFGDGEARYRRLIDHLPIALLQVDASVMGRVFGALRASGTRDLDAYLAAHPELVDFASEAVRVTEANREALALFGGTPAELLGPVGYVFAASPETARRVMAARFDGRRSHTEVTRIRTFEGRLLDVRLSVSYPSSPDPLDVTLISLEDVTERLRIERQLRQLEADFTHAARISILGELATSIAHEVNQPLSAIVTNGETSLRWLARPHPDLARVGLLADRIVASARRASEIVQRIRSMAARRPPERAPVDLNTVVEEAVMFVRHDIETEAITLATAFAPALPPVRADRIELQQVIVNLLLNSVQAMADASRAERRIALATRARPDGGVAFRLDDTGPGIAPADRERVFDSFFTTKAAGMGIGLAVSRSIMLAHGGGIRAATNADGGARFEFWLPAPDRAGRGASLTRMDDD